MSNSDKINAIPPLPRYLFEELEKTNSALALERESFDQAIYKLNVSIRFASHYSFEDMRMREIEMEEDPKLVLEVDWREKVSELKEKIVKEFPKGIEL